MRDCAELVDRVRELLEDRLHPERRVGILSPVNLTRITIRFGALGLSAGVVHALVGWSVLEVPLTVVAVGAADRQVGAFWKQIKGGVQHAWTAVGMVALVIIPLATSLRSVAPDSPVVRGARSAAGSLLESMQASVENRARNQRTLVDTAGAVGERWRVLLDSNMVRRGTFVEAKSWSGGFHPASVGGPSSPPGPTSAFF